MQKILKIIFWWGVLSALWGVYRVLGHGNPEFVSEVIAKPIIWLGVTFLFVAENILPKKTFQKLRRNYLQVRPAWQVFLLPVLAIIAYFFLLNFRQIHFPTFSWSLLTMTLMVNFATGIVEEIVYRGVLYVSLLDITDEVSAFVLVQVLFLLGHLPTLAVNSSSLTVALTHAFFIVFIGAAHTLVFRLTKSLYASSLTHGIWNSLVYYLLLSST